MTDRHAGYVVTLQQELREDDAAKTVAAIRQLKGVATVHAIRVTPELQIAEERARIGIMLRIGAAFDRETEEAKA